MTDSKKKSSKEARVLVANILEKMSKKYKNSKMKEAAKELKESTKNMKPKN